MDAADIVQLIGKGQYIDKAAHLGVFAETAFISHLILDNMAEGGLNYLFPLYNKPISVFSYMNVKFSGVDFLHYNLACLVSRTMLLAIMFMISLP